MLFNNKTGSTQFYRNKIDAHNSLALLALSYIDRIV